MPFGNRLKFHEFCTHTITNLNSTMSEATEKGPAKTNGLSLQDILSKDANLKVEGHAEMEEDRDSIDDEDEDATHVLKEGYCIECEGARFILYFKRICSLFASRSTCRAQMQSVRRRVLLCRTLCPYAT